MTIKTRLIHLKLMLFGNKELEERGKMIPCKECNKLFKSYEHYGEWTYEFDNTCEECREKLKRNTHLIEKIKL